MLEPINIIQYTNLDEKTIELPIKKKKGRKNSGCQKRKDYTNESFLF